MSPFLVWNTTVTDAYRLVWGDKGANPGMCGAFRYLFWNALQIQGLTVDPAFQSFPLGIDPKDANEKKMGGFLVNQWTFGSVSKDDPKYQYTNYVGDPMNKPNPGYPETLTGVDFLPRWDRDANGKWIYLWDKTKAPAVTYTKPTPAQNNNNPRGNFPNHALVRFVFSPTSAALYDASSGLIFTGSDPNAALLNFQDGALAGFYITKKVNGVRAMLIRPVNKWPLEIVDYQV